MSSDVREVKDVLAALAPKIKGCKEELGAQHLGSALYGLKCMSSDVQEVKDVLAALATGDCREGLPPRVVGEMESCCATRPHTL
jgi:hypothetical protein